MSAIVSLAVALFGDYGHGLESTIGWSAIYNVYKIKQLHCQRLFVMIRPSFLLMQFYSRDSQEGAVSSGHITDGDFAHCQSRTIEVLTTQ